MANLYRALFGHARARPEAPCLLVPGGETLSYAALGALSARFAAALAATGVVTGDRVLVQVDKSPAGVALYLGCLRLGAVFVPLNTAYTPAEVAGFVADAAPALVVCRPEALAGLCEQPAIAAAPALATLDAAGRGTLADTLPAAAPDAAVELDADDLAAMLYTSGTTGRSKGAMLSIGNLLANAAALRDAWGYREEDILLHALPVFHAHGLFVALHVPWLAGGAIHWLPRFDTRAVLDALPGCTVMMGVPTFYTRLLAEARLDRAACAHVRVFISGSAPLLPTTFEHFAERTGQRILERYGMTEAGMITSNPLDGARVPGTVGFPLPGVELRVVDEHGRAVPAGTAGDVEIRGPNVFRGYWRLPEKTAAEFRADGFFRTGDVGVLDATGRLTLVGRARDLIISGGFNVYPKEVEDCLDAVPGVAETAVIGVPHADLGETVVAVVVVEPDGSCDAATLRAAMDRELARFKHARHFVFVAALPRNAMGKVQKALLRERYRGIAGGAA